MRSAVPAQGQARAHDSYHGRGVYDREIGVWVGEGVGGSLPLVTYFIATTGCRHCGYCVCATLWRRTFKYGQANRLDPVKDWAHDTDQHLPGTTPNSRSQCSNSPHSGRSVVTICLLMVWACHVCHSDTTENWKDTLKECTLKPTLLW